MVCTVLLLTGVISKIQAVVALNDTMLLEVLLKHYKTQEMTRIN